MLLIYLYIERSSITIVDSLINPDDTWSRSILYHRSSLSRTRSISFICSNLYTFAQAIFSKLKCIKKPHLFFLRVLCRYWMYSVCDLGRSTFTDEWTFESQHSTAIQRMDDFGRSFPWIFAWHNLHWNSSHSSKHDICALIDVLPARWMISGTQRHCSRFWSNARLFTEINEQWETGLKPIS